MKFGFVGKDTTVSLGDFMFQDVYVHLGIPMLSNGCHPADVTLNVQLHVANLGLLILRRFLFPP